MSETQTDRFIEGYQARKIRELEETIVCLGRKVLDLREEKGRLQGTLEGCEKLLARAQAKVKAQEETLHRVGRSIGYELDEEHLRNVGEVIEQAIVVRDEWEKANQRGPWGRLRSRLPMPPAGWEPILEGLTAAVNEYEGETDEDI
jgi:hypothetical protein